jgi:GNAT superfamily N-acetyltransferase
VTIRTALEPGDIGAIVSMHGLLYAREYGFDHTFEAYVAGPLAEFALRASPRERIWMAEADRHLVGCIAIVEASTEAAQLRWFLVDPAARGAGLGKRLMDESVAFCRASAYHSVILWTVSALTTAAHLYRAAGFTKTFEQARNVWGVDVVEEKYELHL